MIFDNYTNKKNNLFHKIYILLIVLWGIIIRFYCAIFHFTHYDDIGVADTIIALGKELGVDSPLIYRMRFLDWGWTYAPFQYIFPSMVLNEEFSYQVNIFIGRLPSLLFGIGSIICCIYIYKKFANNQKYSQSVFIIVLLLIAFSWPNIIYSAQMESYSIGVFSTFLLLIYLLKYVNEMKINYFCLGICLTVLCYSQYQLFLLVFFFYLSVFIILIKKRNYYEIKNLFFTGVFNLIASIPILDYIIKKKLLDRGINWNAGIDGRFLFEIPQSNLIENIEYVYSFFTKNIFLCYKHFFLGKGRISSILAVLLILISCLGWFYLHKNKKYKVISFFIDFVLLSLLLLVLTQKLTLGPSRHILAYYPIVLLLIWFGLLFIFNLKEYKGKTEILSLFILTVTGIFLFNMGNELEIRKNYFSEQKIEQIIDKYDPALICVYGDTFDIYLMNPQGYQNLSDPVGTGLLMKKEHKLQTNDSVVFISRAKLLDESYYNHCKEKMSLHLQSSAADKLLNQMILQEEKIISTPAEVEYASPYYDNFKNGFNFYHYKIN